MKVHFINFGSGEYLKKQSYAARKALKVGKVNSITLYNSSHLPENFKSKNKEVLNQSKGGGYWLWKPYIILDKLRSIGEGEYVFYCDTGAYPISDLSVLINELDSVNQDIMGFQLPLIEKQWTKPSLFKELDCDELKDTPQILASYILVRKTNFAIKFFEKFLDVACDKNNMLDIKLGAFVGDCIEHRHDQSIFSLLYKKYNLLPFKDPSQFGNDPSLFFKGTSDGRNMCVTPVIGNYQTLIFHYRRGNPFIQYIKYNLKRVLNFSRVL